MSKVRGTFLLLTAAAVGKLQSPAFSISTSRVSIAVLASARLVSEVTSSSTSLLASVICERRREQKILSCMAAIVTVVHLTGLAVSEWGKRGHHVGAVTEEHHLVLVHHR